MNKSFKSFTSRRATGARSLPLPLAAEEEPPTAEVEDIEGARRVKIILFPFSNDLFPF